MRASCLSLSFHQKAEIWCIIFFNLIIFIEVSLLLHGCVKTIIIWKRKCLSSKIITKMDFFTLKPPKKIPLKPYMDFSVIYYIKWSVVAIFSVNPMHSVNPMSVKVMHHCIQLFTVPTVIFRPILLLQWYPSSILWWEVDV